MLVLLVQTKIIIKIRKTKTNSNPLQRLHIFSFLAFNMKTPLLFQNVEVSFYVKKKTFFFCHNFKCFKKYIILVISSYLNCCIICFQGKVFSKTATKVKQKKRWENIKYKVIIAAVVVAVAIGIIVAVAMSFSREDSQKTPPATQSTEALGDG